MLGPIKLITQTARIVVVDKQESTKPMQNTGHALVEARTGDYVEDTILISSFR